MSGHEYLEVNQGNVKLGMGENVVESKVVEGEETEGDWG